MKKILVFLFALVLTLTLVGCKKEPADPEGTMTYAQYVAAEFDKQVKVSTYVQAKQSWWNEKATVYSQDQDGAYFLYNMKCSKEDYDKLTPGTKIIVTGYKSQWSGEIEIIDAEFEIVNGAKPFVAKATDVTALLGKEELVNEQNKFVAFKGLKVVGEAMYKYDGSGKEGDDLYFKVELNGATYTFTVESYLCGADTEVYKAVKDLKVGQTVDLEGFLYWYNGVNPHITKVVVK